MTKLYVRSERVVNQPSDFVYRLFADFENHHPKFLPPQFSEIKVTKGGYGAGTEHTFTSLMGGKPRVFKMVITEPEPGRVLVERDSLSDLETITTILPEGNGTRITFETTWESAGGLMGALEAWFAPSMMRRVYQDEFNRFEKYAQEVRQQVLGAEPSRRSTT
jgi:uncharacterized membrane protein